MTALLAALFITQNALAELLPSTVAVISMGNVSVLKGVQVASVTNAYPSTLTLDPRDACHVMSVPPP